MRWVNRRLRGTISPLVLDLSAIAGHRVYELAKLGNGMSIFIQPCDAIGSEIVRTGFFERETVEVFRHILRPGDIFLDVGANVGQYTLIAADLVGAQGQVHSFEPDPVTFERLRQNVEMNSLSNVRLNQFALSDVDAEVTFYEGGAAYTGHSSLVPSGYNVGRSYAVKCQRLVNYMREAGIKAIDVMKIDIEGAEYRLLNGSREFFVSESRPIIVIEFCERTLTDAGTSVTALASLLRGLGYDLYRVSALQAYEARVDDASSFNVLAWPLGSPLHTRGLRNVSSSRELTTE
jgi:FkbM family methyltransferase